ncbi:CDP-glycerol glycerophosphotransferase family protein [Methanobrevibacter sp.]
MSFLKHKVYGKLFSFFKIFPINKNQVSFVVDSNKSFKGNLDYIRKEMEKRGDFEFNFFYKDKISFSNFKKLATSKYIFLNDNFFPLAFMDFRDEACVIQLWHAPGASKKFGGSVCSASELEILSKASDNTDYLISSSKNIENQYMEAFQIDKSKIHPLGVPRIDYYFENHDIDKLKQDFSRKYDVDSDKKIILYAPTFRDEEKYNNVFDYLNLDDFNEALGEEYILVLRLHPKIRNFYKNDISSKGKYIDVSDFESEQELMLISDMMITDYSSIMIEYGILNRPVIFFTYDLDSYLANERGFYYDFKKTVPGPIVRTSDELIDVIKNDKFEKEKIGKFIKTQFDVIDGESSKRVVDFILNDGR